MALFATLLLLFCSDAALAHRAVTPEARNTWITRHQRMASAARQAQPQVVFIGDSITDFWARSAPDVWKAYYTPLNAANYGIGGDRTESLLWRLEHGAFDGIDPKVVVLLIGTNNSRRDSVEQIAEGVAAVVAKIHTELPRTKILLLAIFPRGKTFDDELNAKVMAVNPLIAKLADDKQVFFLDIGKNFLGQDGNIDRQLMPDYLHLSKQGYRIWAEQMQPTLQKLLAE